MAIGSTAAQLFVRVGADTSDAESGLLGLSGTLNSMAADMARTGGLMTAGLTVPIAGVGLSAVKTAADYQSSMNMFQAVTGASADQMAQAGTLAKQLGADMTLPATSAGDAAVAMTELAKGGLSVQDAMAGARGVLELSAAGQISTADAATIAANALNTFGLSGTEATRVADLLAAAANASSSDVGDLAYGLQAGGAVFAAAGVPLDQFITMLSEMSNAGIKGQDAGTSLKSMLLALEHPTKKAQETMSALGISIYDAQGNMRPFRDIIGNLQSSMGDLTQQQRDQAMATLFGSDGIRAATVLTHDGVDGFDKMAVSVNKQGAAADLANARMQGLQGALEGLNSTIQTVMLNAVQPFMTAMEGLVRQGAELAGQLDTLDPSVKNAAFAFAGVLAVAGPLLLGMAGLATVLGFVLTPIGLLVVGLAAFSAWIASSPERLAAFETAAHTAFDWLRENLWEPFLAAAQIALGWLHDTALPAIQSAATAAFQWLTSTGWPAFSSAAQTVLGWLHDTALPAIAAGASAAFGWLSGTAWPGFQTAASTALDWLVTTGLPAANAALGQMHTSVGLLSLGFSELGSGNITTGLYALGQAFGANLLPAMQALQPAIDFLRPQFDALVLSAQQLAAVAGEQVQPILVALGPLLQQLGALAQTLAPIVGTALTLAFNGVLIVLRGVSEILTTLAPLISGTVVLAMQALTVAVQDVNTAVQKMSDLVKALASGDWSTAWEALKQIVITLFSTLPADVGAVIGPAALQVGKDIVAGLIQGIEGSAPQIADAIAGLATQALAAAKATLGIASPSTEFAALGQQSAAGFQMGFQQSAASLSTTIQNTLNGVLDTIKGKLSLIDMQTQLGDLDATKSSIPQQKEMIALQQQLADLQLQRKEEGSRKDPALDTRISDKQLEIDRLQADLDRANRDAQLRHLDAQAEGLDLNHERLLGEQMILETKLAQLAAQQGLNAEGVVGPFAANPVQAVSDWQRSALGLLGGPGAGANTGQVITINAPLIGNLTVRNDQDLDRVEGAIFDAFDKGESGALSTRGHSGGASGGSGGGLGLPSPPIHFTVPA